MPQTSRGWGVPAVALRPAVPSCERLNGELRWVGRVREPAELLLARAKDALAAAKDAGRNLTIAAD